jgi:hypothetical protein
MKKYILTLFLTHFIFSGFSQNQKNDSIKRKEPNFLFGISITPNYSWRKYYNDSIYGTLLYGAPQYESPDYGCSFMLHEKMMRKRFMFNVGSGIGFYNYKGHYQYDVPQYSSKMYTWVIDYKYKHVFMEIHTDYNLLLGKNKSWNIGVIGEFSLTTKFSQEVKRQLYEVSSTDPPSKYKDEDYYNASSYVAWGGLTVGKSVRVAKWLIMSCSLNCKYSSKIKTGQGVLSNSSSTSYHIKVQSRSLMTSSFTISFYPISKRKQR